MRTIAKKHSFITLLVLLITGVLISGWALALHYEDKKNTVHSKELDRSGQVTTEKPLGLDLNNSILVLVCVGLIGFFGVRRQSKKLENFVKVKHPEKGALETILNEKDPEMQACRRKIDVPEECFLNGLFSI